MYTSCTFTTTVFGPSIQLLDFYSGSSLPGVFVIYALLF